MKKLSIPVGEHNGPPPMRAIPCFQYCKLPCHGVPDIMVESIALVQVD